MALNREQRFGESGPEDRKGLLQQLEEAKKRIEGLNLQLSTEKDAAEKRRLRADLDATEAEVQSLETTIREGELDTT